MIDIYRWMRLFRRRVASTLLLGTTYDILFVAQLTRIFERLSPEACRQCLFIHNTLSSISRTP
jgi:hypothetical protein